MAPKNTQLMNGHIFSSSNDALIFTTMCIVGLPVEVQVKDGSIYAGIFHTACIEKDYGVVLKMARMIRRGMNTDKFVGGATINTLVVLPEDLVQVVAKVVMLPSDGHHGDAYNENEAAVSRVSGTVQPLHFDCERVVKPKSAELDEDDPKRFTQEALVDGQNKSLVKSEGCMQANDVNQSSVGNTLVKGFNITGTSANPPDITEVAKDKAVGIPCLMEEASGAIDMDDKSQDVQYGSPGDENAFDNNEGHSEETLVHEKQNSNSPKIASFHPCGKSGGVKSEKVPSNVPVTHESPSSSSRKVESVEQLRNSNATLSDALSSNSSTSSPLSSDFPSASSTAGSVFSKNSISSQNSKEFKLNPGAKIFSPLSMNLKTATPTVSNADQVLDISMLSIIDAQPGIQLNPPMAHAALPVKYSQYNNLAAGNGGSYPQTSQPVSGHIGIRSQPVRYVGQYVPPQGGSMYVHPGNQTVMASRMAPVVYVPSFSQDSVHGVSALPPGLMRPLLSTHQPLLPKHYGAAAQPMQLCVAPPFAPGIHQPLVVPSHLPNSQPFPTIRPIPVASGTGALGSKLAM